MNNNAVEQLNSIVAKFVGRKRINFCLRHSYQMKCNTTVMAHNSICKSLVGCGPGFYTKLFEKRARRQNSKYEKKKKKHRCTLMTQKIFRMNIILKIPIWMLKCMSVRNSHF